MRSREPIEKLTSWIGSEPSLILHTAIFVSAFVLASIHIVDWSFMLLVLTTLVSLEAIYLAIFIQMTVNRQAENLAEVTGDVEGIQEDIDEIQKDVDEIQEDVEEIQEDVEEITDENVPAEESVDTLEQITRDIHRILADLEQLKKK